MPIILFDTPARNNLFPLTLTRAVADLRMGVLTIKERWETISRQPVFVLTEPYLQQLYPLIMAGDYFFIDACLLPTSELVEKIFNLKTGESLGGLQGLLAGRAVIEATPSIDQISSLFTADTLFSTATKLAYPFDLFQRNKEMIEFDFTLLSEGKTSQPLNPNVQVSSPENIFVEEGANVDFSVLNGSTGPIYIGKNATIMEGCVVRGPFAMGEGSVLKMGSKIYGATTLGPFCMGGGEIKNSILMGYSNKAHDGYLGDSVIGHWCNMGAGTSNSNLKNTGGTVQLYNYPTNSFIAAGNKCGVIMGDYSRTAINSSINTGAVIGVCCNVFGNGLLPKFIPDFTWGTNNENVYEFEKAVHDVDNWQRMKNKTINRLETQVLEHIFELSPKRKL